MHMRASRDEAITWLEVFIGLGPNDDAYANFIAFGETDARKR